MRIRLHLVLLALATVLALGLVACGDDDDGGDSQTRDPRALLERAISNPPDSGQLKVNARIGLDGVDALDGPISLRVNGAYESRGEKELPDADWDVTARAAGLALNGGLKIVDGTVYLEFQGDAYELGNPKKELEEESDGGGNEPLAGIDLDPASWLEDLKVEDGQEIGGDSTQRITGTVDAERAVRDLVTLLDSPVAKDQLGPNADLVPELSDEDLGQVREAIDRFTIEANVDEDDVLRRVLVKARFDVPSDAGVEGPSGGDITFDYVLEKVGGGIDVKAPRNAQSLGELLRGFGIEDPFGLAKPRSR